MARKLRVGLIGLGSICQGGHIPGWLSVPNAEIVAGADPSAAARERTARSAGVKPEALYGDYRQMLKEVELDVCDICTPQLMHLQPTLEAFKAGCHVHVEKPMATSAKDCRRMIEAGKRAGKLIMVGQTMRFMEESLALKRWVEAGLVGDIYWARACWLRARGVPTRPSFIVKEQSAGGPCYDIGVHMLDLCLYLMGHPEPVAVSANVWLKLADKPSLMKHDHKTYGVPDDMAAGFIRFDNGACLSLETSWALNYPADDLYHVFLAGTKGGIKSNPATLVREQAGLLTDTTVQVNPDASISAHVKQIQVFAQAVTKGLPSPVPGEQALLTQRILDGVYKSARLGREVKA